ncbi:MAG: ribosome recycling factor [Acidimicrobiales bacterium]
MDDSLVGVALDETRERMAKAVEHASAELGSIRTGRAAPALVEKIKVGVYGSEIPLQQLAGFTVPEARLLVINPYDKSSIKAIGKAIQQSDLGITPSDDGQVIRLAFPPLTTERRKDMVRLARAKAEEARVAVRNVRRSVRHELDGLEREGEITADELERAGKDLDKLTHEYVSEIDRVLSRKEQDLLEI